VLFLLLIPDILTSYHEGQLQNVCERERACEREKGSQAKTNLTKKLNAMLGQCIEILNWFHANGKSQTNTAKHFKAIYPELGIKQLLISLWVKNEEKWQKEFAQCGEGIHLHSMKHACQTQHLEISKMMDLWVTKVMVDVTRD
jgi:hypothetical protein